jgi:hypothetical protein
MCRAPRPVPDLDGHGKKHRFSVHDPTQTIKIGHDLTSICWFVSGKSGSWVDIVDLEDELCRARFFQILKIQILKFEKKSKNY